MQFPRDFVLCRPVGDTYLWIMRLPRDINHPNIRFVGFLNFGATSVTGD